MRLPRRTGPQPRRCPRCGSPRPCSPYLPLELLEDVVELLALRLQVAFVVSVRFDLDRDALRDLEPEPSQSHDLRKVVGNQADALQAEVLEDLGPDPVVSQVRGEAEPLVRLYGVEPLVLEMVGLHLVEEPYAPALLLHVDDHAFALCGDALHRRPELLAAVAAQRVQRVACEARQ